MGERRWCQGGCDIALFNRYNISKSSMGMVLVNRVYNYTLVILFLVLLIATPINSRSYYIVDSLENNADNYYKCIKKIPEDINIYIRVLDNNTIALTIQAKLPDPSYIINFVRYSIDKEDGVLNIYIISCRLNILATPIAKHVNKSFKLNVSLEGIKTARIYINNKLFTEYSIEEILGAYIIEETTTLETTTTPLKTTSMPTTWSEVAGYTVTPTNTTSLAAETMKEEYSVLEKTSLSLLIAVFIAFISWIFLKYK